MQAAFAKLLLTKPVQSSQVDFRAGGNGVPILTRASGQSTAGYQTMGLPGGNMPYPGGGANKTTLGSIRMGDDDGSSPASAIVGGVGEIFFPYRAPDRVYPERMFSCVGNNVFQPPDDIGTVELLRKLGDQKFKAKALAPFEDYARDQRLAKDIEEASRNASPADAGLARDILRSMAAERRAQNEADYLRKMLDGGATPEAAQAEIQNVRNANALQEAKTVNDREYQSKLLLQNLAKSRGITPMVREPLNQSQAIDNPQRSQAMSQAMGKPGEGFGTSPLDANRVAILPKDKTRRPLTAAEAEDEAIAINNMITASDGRDRLNLSNMASGYSMATLRGQERQGQIEKASEDLAARLEAIRQRAVRIKYPLASPVVAEEIISKLYSEKAKKAGDEVLFTPETIDELNPLQVLLSINNSVQTQPNGGKALTDALKLYNFGTPQRPSPNLLKDLKEIAAYMNGGEQNVRIPFASANTVIPVAKLVDLLNGMKSGSADMASKVKAGRAKLLLPPPSPVKDDDSVPEVPLARRTREDAEDVTPAMAKRQLPGAGRTVIRRPTPPPLNLREIATTDLTQAMVNRMGEEELRERLESLGEKIRKNAGAKSMRKTLRQKIFG
jgi:hypothetical protein